MIYIVKTAGPEVVSSREVAADSVAAGDGFVGFYDPEDKLIVAFGITNVISWEPVR